MAFGGHMHALRIGHWGMFKLTAINRDKMFSNVYYFRSYPHVRAINKYFTNYDYAEGLKSHQ